MLGASPIFAAAMPNVVRSGLVGAQRRAWLAAQCTNPDDVPHLWAAIDASANAVVLSGTFVTNSGHKVTQTPFKLGSNTYVFGAKELSF